MKPDLPKRLAAMIRASQARMLSARVSVANYLERIESKSERIAEYEVDPALFAARYYGRNSFDSYPVQTNIERCREDLEYRLANIDRKRAELAQAELKHQQLEEQVACEVESMRPGTPGRVPWPSPPPTVEAILQQWRLEQERERRRAIARR